MDTANSEILHRIFSSLRNVALHLQEHDYGTSSVITAVISCFLVIYLQSMQTATIAILWEKSDKVRCSR